MWPSASLCVRAHDDENPSPPASRPSRRSRSIPVTSSSVAARALASRPITTRRMAEWPTMKAALMPSRPSMAAR